MKIRACFPVIAILGFLALASVISAQNGSSDSQPAVKRQIKSKTEPSDPPLAKQMHVNGKVKIELTVAADGAVRDTKVLGGSPILVRAAVDAVKVWKYQPSPRETTETVEFVFNNP